MITKKELAEIDALVVAPPEEQVSAEELGRWLGISGNRVHTLGRDGIIPRNAAKQYPLRAAIRAYCDHARAGATGRRADTELAAEKLRLAKEQADKIAFANARARGELISAGEVERAWAGVLRDVRAAFLALPSRAASKLGHLTPHDLAALDEEVRDVLLELAEHE